MSNIYIIENITKKQCYNRGLLNIEIIEIHEIHTNGWLPGPRRVVAKWSKFGNFQESV